MNDDYSFKKSITETYYFRWGHGDWAKFYIDCKQNTFSCNTSFGDFSYIYWKPGDQGFKKFLISLVYDKAYLLKKISKKQFDLDESIRAWKNRIITWRKFCSDDFSKEDAREAWDKIMNIYADIPDGPEGKGAFYERLSCINEIKNFDWWEDAYEESYPYAAHYFVDEIYPMFIKELRKELAKKCQMI